MRHRHKLLRGDVQGTARAKFGVHICRYCVSMLRLAVEGQGEYIVQRCGRCGLAVDSRQITAMARSFLITSRLVSMEWDRNYARQWGVVAIIKNSHAKARKERKVDRKTEPCPHCGCTPRPALEHNRGCKIRREFYGGDGSWDITKDQKAPDGTRYAYREDMDTWMPVFEPIPDYQNPSEY